MMRLSPVDHIFTGRGAYPINFLFFYNTQLNEAKLRSSLDRVLTHFWPLSATLTKFNDHTLAFDSAKRHYGFCVHQVSQLEDLGDLKALSKRLKGADSELAPKNNGALLEITLTHHSKGSCLGVSASHCVVDGYSYFMFLSAWAKALRGEQYPIPELNRELLCPAFNDKAPAQNARSVFLESGFSVSEKKRPTDADLQWDVQDYKKEEVADYFKSLSQASTQRLSVNDVMAAKTWKEFASNRQKLGQTLRLSCAYDVRRIYSKIDATYFGNAIRCAALEMDFAQLMDSSDLAVAQALSAVVRSINEAAVIMAFNSLESYRCQKSYAAMEQFHVADPDIGFLTTNLTRLALSELDFGVGAPYDFRILTPAPRTAVFLTTSTGGFRVQIAS